MRAGGPRSIERTLSYAKSALATFGSALGASHVASGVCHGLLDTDVDIIVRGSAARTFMLQAFRSVIYGGVTIPVAK